jgi:outer membrane immunogenic protein
VGGNISYGDGAVDAQGELSDLLSENGFSSTISEPSGTTGAIRGGYDWENNMAVFGVGAEYSFGEYDGGLDGVLGDVADITDDPLRDLSFGIEQMMTIYARAGLLANDNFMVYGLLGWTWADGSISLEGETLTQDLDGYTLGIGGEYLFSQNWSAYGEYSSTNFDEIDNTFGLLEADIDLVKAGLNYRF